MSKHVEGGPKSGDGDICPATPRAVVQPEAALMNRIHARWNADILSATRGSSVIPAFLAALAANESGGDPAARAFEPEVYRSLRAVILGEAFSFGSITARDLVSAFEENFRSPAPDLAEGGGEAAETEAPLGTLTAAQDQALRRMATSWGLTQIMGYRILGRKETVEDLLAPLFHLRYAVRLLEGLGRRFTLDLSKDFESLFQAWNCGHPGGKTYDPQYVPRGMQRMSLYETLERGHQAGPSQGAE